MLRRMSAQPDTARPSEACCRYGATQPPAVPMRRFDASREYGPAFDHPRAWSEVQYDDLASSFATTVVFLSNVAIHDPCTRTYTSGGTLQGERCGDAVEALGPGGVFVSWVSAGMPHGPGPEIPHPNAKISGRPAEVSTARRGSCGRLGAQETITADVAIDHDHEFEMTACLRGPNLAREET
jgi:hypothetical protein